jgi:AcrR family transcriptional regulator
MSIAQFRRPISVPTPARTSLEDIIAAARGILETDGLDGLTMQRVARAVGVRPPSLYKRVRSRGDLVRLVVENVARQLGDVANSAVGSGDPKRDLGALAHAVRGFARANPQAYVLIFSALPDAWRPELTTLAPASEAVLGVAATLGGPDHALEAARMIVAWAHGFVSMELSGAFQLGGDVDEAFAFGVDRLTEAISITRP